MKFEKEVMQNLAMVTQLGIHFQGSVKKGEKKHGR